MAELAIGRPAPPPIWLEALAWFGSQISALVRLDRTTVDRSNPGERLPTIRIARNGVTLGVSQSHPDGALAGSLQDALQSLKSDHVKNVALYLEEDRYLKRSLSAQRLPFATAQRMAELDVAANTPFALEDVYIFFPSRFGEGGTAYFLVAKKILNPVLQEVLDHRISISSVLFAVGDRTEALNSYTLNSMFFRKRMRSKLVLQFAFYAAVLTLMLFPIIKTYQAMIESLDNVTAQVEALKPKAIEARRKFKQRDELLSNFKSFTNRKNAYEPVVRTVETLSALLDDGTYLISLAVNGNKVSIRGYSGSAAGIVPELSGNGYFKSVRSTSAFLKVPGRDGEQFSFELEVSDGR
ncbi:PilN domain-containing protein [Rhizobium alvei]|uniref:PilN domain-containing protein n=1 Tax=Rhizobium alvei TaxID=1132659 RepID=A0ABT8YNG6_9HYPH|nr:PilN domain-containing protein [Rhizobium alvei]MDO6965239.1 PilN domain-containing protein [Rhizobium alvei]